MHMANLAVAVRLAELVSIVDGGVGLLDIEVVHDRFVMLFSFDASLGWLIFNQVSYFESNKS